jgi:hypothetical protein
MTTYDRPRGTLIRSLDRDALTALLLTKYELNAGAVASANAVAFTDKGYATLHTEGVGYFANEDGSYSVSVWFDGVSHGWVDVALDDLLALPYEVTDLADYIRNYNDRLENNFYTWRAVIKQEVTA